MLKQPAVGNLIRDLRGVVGLTQEQFAAEVGVTYNTVNRWERGHMQPSPLALKQIDRILQETICSPSPHASDQIDGLVAKYEL
jgi:putative transcriptional regulator